MNRTQVYGVYIYQFLLHQAQYRGNQTLIQFGWSGTQIGLSPNHRMLSLVLKGLRPKLEDDYCHCWSKITVMDNVGPITLCHCPDLGGSTR